MSYLPRIPRGWVVLALVRRDFLTARSYRAAFVLDTAFGLANILVYYFISRALGNVTTPNLSGAPTYFAFAAVGASMSLVIQAATTGLARRVREEQLTGTLEVLVGQPVSSTEIALGVAGFPFMFAMLRVALYITMAGWVLDLPLGKADWIGFAVTLLTSGASLAAVGIVLGGLVVAIKRGDALIMLTVFALGLFGGAVFPRTVLPSWLQTLTAWVPTRFAFDGVRNSLFLGSGWANEAMALLIIAVVLLPVGLLVFKLAINWARRRGSLGEY
jgi:ABC-type multidrug transport system permease subunit